MLSQPLALVALVTSVAAHGHVAGIVADGVWYSGWNPSYQYQNPVPLVPGWASNNLDNGFVAPDAFATSDIICHKAATNGKAYVNVKAGSKLTIQWDTWPISHKGPVIDYLAPCGSDCTTVDKTTLKFIKIDAAAWKSGSNPGNWVTDDLVANNYSWTSTVPSSLASGNYVLRHEILALHSAGNANGAQAYPQCINLKVTGSGSSTASGGVSATTFYKANDPGILFNLYTTFSSYTIPGPAVVSLARRHVKDFVSKFI